MTNIEMTTLNNGLRVITDHVPSVESVALGIWTGIGTRHEDLSNNGIAHMVEHMLFKGTPSRNAQQIVEEIEAVGGHMNAYTSREVTSYHVHLMKENADLALGVLADMYQNSTLPEDEIETERQVIIQEIGMCNDTPDDLIFDTYYETAYPQQSMGAPILGTEKHISRMKREDLAAYVEKFYTPENTVISAAGNLSHEAFVQKVTQSFSNLPKNKGSGFKTAEYVANENRSEKELEQAHILLGFQAYPRAHDSYYAAQALSTLFGGGMSSRLFQEVREKRGLVYSIFSFYSAYHDNGQFGIYAGTGPDKLKELMPIICDEILKTCDEIREEEVQRAIVQLKSSILMSRESMMSRANQNAKSILLRDKVFDAQEVVQEIESVSLEKVKHVAREIFSSAPTLASLGPLSQMENYEKIKARLAS